MWIFKEKRQLARERDELLDDLARKNADIKNLRQTNGNLLSEISILKTDKQSLKDQLEREVKKRTELADKLREQTEADLLINALKACGVIKAEKKQDHFAEAARLDSLRNYALDQRSYAQRGVGYGQADFLGFGLGAILGGQSR